MSGQQTHLAAATTATAAWAGGVRALLLTGHDTYHHDVQCYKTAKSKMYISCYTIHWGNFGPSEGDYDTYFIYNNIIVISLGIFANFKWSCPTKKQYLGVWHADWVFGAPESTVNNVK
jgi:hypothetical protein